MKFPDDVISVLSGDVSLGAWVLVGGVMAKEVEVIPTDEFQGCSLVSDRHETHQTGVGRIAGGILGGLLLGPIGAAGGLLAGGKRKIDETIVYCTLRDGREFSAEVSPLMAAKIQQICQSNILSEGRRDLEIPNQASLMQASKEKVALAECPMCAENIQAKAKICRYCGYKIFEAREKAIARYLEDASVLSVNQISDLIKKYRLKSEEENQFTEDEIVLVLEGFSRLMKKDRRGYREMVDAIRDDLGLPSKTAINELIRVGFGFIREGNSFEIADGLLIVKR